MTKPIHRDESYKQPNPRMQLIAMISSVYGDLLDIEGGVAKERIPRMIKNVRGMLSLIQQMPDGEWENPPKPDGS